MTIEPGTDAVSSSRLRRQAYWIFAVLSAGFVASQFYRVSNAAIAPELMQTLAISPESIGVITGMYFLVFAAAQLPAGVLLDRIGPRRTMAGLFAIAVAGSAVFALAEGPAGLAIGRGLMGLGCATGLMGALVAIARWFPPGRFAQLSSLLYAVGGIGFLLATTPLAAISEWIGWRGAFWIMAAVTALLALALYAVVRDAPPGHLAHDRAAETPRQIAQGLRQVLGNRQLRLVCAIQFVTYGTVLAVIGLWAGPYLNDVHGLKGIARGNLLMVLNISTLVGVMVFPVIERRLDSRKWAIAGGAMLSIVLLAVLAAVPGLALWPAMTLLVLFGLTSAYVMLIHAHARAVLPDHLVGRGLTLQNLAVFLGVFVIQSVSGYIVGYFTEGGGPTPVAAYQAVFGFLAVATLIALLVYLRVRDISPREQGS